MSKALVIKGASFALNKVETIVISEPVPCTGISLSQSTINATQLGATTTLAATVTPSDTTDTITWVSSDEDVATVANGVVTTVGIGSAIITAMCGTQSATCEVNSTHTIVLNNEYSIQTGYRYSGSLALNVDPPKNHIGLTTDENAEVFYNSVNEFDYRMFIYGGSDQAYIDMILSMFGMPIPSGTSKITVTPPSSISAGTDRAVLLLANADEKQTYVGGAAGNSALGLAAFRQPSSAGAVPFECDISSYTAANAFAVTVKNNGTGGVSAIGDVSVTFS